MGLEDKVKLLPEEPGVYIFRDSRGDVIYVGKASSLKNRVKSYFQSARNLTARILSMVEQARDLDYIVTGSEVEALILESNLIKKYRPKYNIRLRDDKHYPYLRVTTNEEWPRVVVARSMEEDGSRYFGPYTRAGAVHETLHLIRKIFPLRTCSDNVFKNVERPCLNYHIKRCLAPCKNLVSREDYLSMVRDICLFLEGRPEVLANQVKERMEYYAENLEFEKAAKLRDQLWAIQEITEKQKIISNKMKNQDIMGVYIHSRDAMVQILQVRRGKMTGAEQLALSGPDNQSTPEVVRAALTQYYSVATEVPPEILLPVLPEDASLIEDWLSSLRGQKVKLLAPSRGQGKELVDMAARNAEFAMDEARPRSQRERELARKALEELARALGLPDAPARIECYDISNIQGQHAVGSMVVFEDGVPNKDAYRRFKIKTVEGQDDFAMMAEVIERRFKRGIRERQEGVDTAGSFARFPELIVIDGGKGQLNAALGALSSLGLSIPMIGLAKREEEIFKPGEPDPTVLDRHSQALMLLQRIRDEAHRFAVGYHRKIRSSESRKSILDEIPGVGPKRRAALLKQFGSIRAISEASVEELARVKGMNLAVAKKVLDHLASQPAFPRKE